MAKKSWFSIVKSFFVSDTQTKQNNKEKRRRWVFGRLKIKRLPSITAPAPAPPSPLKERTLNEAEEEQSKHALNVAIASTAAAEAAVAAAHAAAEVVWLTGLKARNQATELEHQCEKETQELAAVKIQTAFRGYLARKALRALRGIVKLQAIIRGQTVRRQAMTTLKCLQSIINIQSHVCARRFQTKEGDTYNYDEYNDQFQNLRDKIIRMDSNSQRRWDDRLVSKEEAEALFMSKKEAMLKRERIKEYWYSHRKSAESERKKVNGRWRYWLDQWVDTQISKSKELEDLDTVLASNRKEEFGGGKQVGLRNLQRQNSHLINEGMDSPRKSSLHHRKQCSLGDENSFTRSPIVPTYMAATKSAKLKARSLSSPKLRPWSLDTCSESYSPCKNNNISLISSINSEVPLSSRRIGKSGGIQQRSPSMKGLPSPVKSSQTMKDRSINSECSVSYWDRQSTFR
ncbi:putative IQ motif, EF-hand binding protein [Rosa chinensis]|uniref:Putative IQ motif, EF-hand binding protein n=1 Tax=Rosa chinensis TaxID=74649 RepID=A0A2P6S8E0_ROSCH|nr:protein IQ-DOMAIN 14 [Rosa chinensis]XP_024175918.1 protein IQ-DOMAIN 14 [Rosa chinensis]XP_040366027.1 protein IQ-DOMAIN 14 [Rosa chinensis]XP_040366028.1 protein IQ-DOMAIN 14 [Rosa chinensis]XP_040366029.1 protein IQ-DOMAIN 14 [Rosa chinensis]XP_040366031.1 protein IQ-DOMAIN 14 [Rosa chinensis]XP_040366034.1 protein IQ-DOMAIN 14 [Rosa chinensis]XP_040366035.1 protein IQ-DOMAIN 14 [Rosa chinensis]XP_040366038.1 protein IQ-DOMAIN 14 [Rosa chinensis]XP_040366043.1 protein IQ-DOMAIN 14 [R